MATTDSLPVPRKNVAFRAHFDLRLNTGALNSGAAGLDSEVSKDDGTMTDCTNEATEVASSSGHYYLDLTSTEMNADSVVVQIKSSTTNAVTRTLILHPQETGDIKVDVTSWLGTAVATPGTAGVPSVDVLRWNTTLVATPNTAGVPKTDMTIINGSATAAARIALSGARIGTGTVDTAGFSPTTTAFETSSIVEATTDHYKDRIIIWATGAMADQQQGISGYTLVSGRGHFALTPGTEAPANGDTFIIV